MSSVILELSQAEAQNVNVNGDYNISLPQNADLLLEAGDSIQLKNVFVDTESQSSQKIVIKKDIEASLSFYHYYIYSRRDEVDNYNGSANVIDLDAQPYIVCKDISAGANLVHLEEISIDNKTPIDMFIEFEIRYTNSSGVATVYKNSIADLKPFAKINKYISLVYNSTQPIELVTTGAYDNNNNKNPQPKLPSSVFPTLEIVKSTPVSTTEPHFEPILSTKTFTIEKGNYSPQLLSREINRQLQTAGSSGEENSYLAKNEFLKNFDGDSENLFLVKQDGSEILELNGQLIIGASQVDLEFEPDTNQFSWNFIHMPYFTTPTTDAPGQPAIGYIGGTPVGGLTTYYLTVNKNSGIVFTSLTSTYSDNTPANLWDTILGFDLTNSDIRVNYRLKTLVNYNGVAVLTTPEIFPPLLDGKNTTGGFIPLSSQVNRTSTTWFKPAVEITPPPGGVTGTPFLSTSVDTVNILGSQDTLSNTEFSYGYFLVEIQGNFKTNYYSNEKSPNIMAIVSRYYELNSFTSGTEGDSLVYTHVGDPITLSSFGVRIMTPQKVVADNLGANTAVFLEIVKGTQQ